MKFKIGELVTLSAAGKLREHNHGFTTGFGIIMEYYYGHSFPYKIRWFSESKKNKEFSAKEYELKRYKVKK